MAEAAPLELKKSAPKKKRALAVSRLLQSSTGCLTGNP
jgi:hypothetical protein